MKYFLILFAISWCGVLDSQSFISSGDPFGTRNFIENKGQYADVDGDKVHYALDNGHERIFFTSRGLTYELIKLVPLSERERERAEHSGKDMPNHDRRSYVHMRWQATMGAEYIEPSVKQQHYFTFGGPESVSRCYKKLLYKNVYPHIDIEYEIPAGTTHGIKYSVMVHPGADIADIRIVYGGDAGKVSLQEDGSVKIGNAIEDIIEQAPLSFLKGGARLSSNFVLTGNTIGFEVEGGNIATSELVIDPWVATTNTLTSNAIAYDIDYDFLGNTFIYGGNNPFKVACYSSGGTLTWVFGGTVTNPSWTSAPYAYASNFGVNRFVSKTYIGQGYAGGGSQVIRLDANGFYDNFMNSANNQFQEVWDMGFHCTTAEVFVLGGGTSSNITAVSINSVSATLTLTAFQPSVSAAGQDIVSHAVDDQTNIFVIGAGNTSINNKILRVNSAFNNNLWNQPSGFNSFGELGNKQAYTGISGVSSNGFNALAVNGNYLFYYDGTNLAAYNKSNGAQTASLNIGGTLKAQGGIAVDDCNNLYLGGNGSIRTYSFNGTSFSSLTAISLSVSTTNQFVFDIKLDKSTKKLYVCGSGFAGVYDPSYSFACSTLSSQCLFAQGGINVSSTSVTCAHPGSATVTATGGTGPFSYTWLPSGQTGSAAVNLNPGSHAVVVHDQGINNTYTASVYLPPLQPLSGTVANPLTLNCHGVFNGTAQVINYAGGSGHHSYLWSYGNSTQTTAIAVGLGLGNHTVTITDSITNCQLTNTFVVVQPSPLALNVAKSAPTACAGNSITLTSLIGGGTPNYTYKWTNGPATGVYNVTDVAGLHVYTVTATDSKSCDISYTLSLTFLNTPTITVSSVSICPLETATLTASGATSYTWNNNNTGGTIAVNPLLTTVYTVTGHAQQCSSTATVAVILKPVPLLIISSNGPRCAGDNLLLYATGGTSYQWNGPLSFNSLQQNPQITNVTTGVGGVYSATATANSCTASASTQVVINANPVVSALGSTVCETGTLSLQGNSNVSPASFVWSGPNAFYSLQQNPQIPNPALGASGTYSLEVTDQNACSARTVAQVTVFAQPHTLIVSNSPLCENAALTLSAAGTPAHVQFAWAGPDGFTANVQNTGLALASLAANGEYTVTLTNGPCVNKATHNVVVNPLPVINIGGNPEVCETKTLNLHASSSGTIVSWLWKAPNNYFSGFQNISRSPASQAMAGTYTLTAANNFNCYSSITIGVLVHTNPVLTVTDMTVCLNAPAVFSALGADTYLWYGPGGFLSAGSNPTLTSATGAGVQLYTVIGTGLNTCTSSAVVALSTRPLPVPSITLVPGAELCVGKDITLRGSGGTSYVWRGPESVYYEGEQVTFNLHNTAFAGIYSLTVTDPTGCSNSTVTNVVIHELPIGDLLGKKEGCVPLCSEYSLAAADQVSGSWRLDGKAIAPATFAHCFPKAQAYTLTASLYDALTTCSNSVEFFVNVYPKPHADFTYLPELVVENSEPVLFTASPGEPGTTYTWYYDHKKGGPVRSESYSTIFENDGTYRIALLTTNAMGCADSIVKVITVEQGFHLFIPNAFTPNSDFTNNQFLPVMRGVKTFHMRVFNRWGALLFETRDQQSGWDGTHEGKPCKEDIYVYQLEAGDGKGASKQLKGHLTLYR